VPQSEVAVQRRGKIAVYNLHGLKSGHFMVSEAVKDALHAVGSNPRMNLTTDALVKLQKGAHGRHKVVVFGEAFREKDVGVVVVPTGDVFVY